MSNQLKGRQKQIRRSPRKLVKTEDNVYKKYLAKTRYGLKFQKESERRKRDILQTSPRQRKEAPAVIKQKTFETKIQQLCKEYNDKETNIKQEKTPDKPAEDIEQNKHVTVKTKRLVNAETYYEIYKMQNKERRKHLAILRDQQQRTELDRKRTMKANKTNLKNPRNIIMNKKSKLKQVTLKQATNKRKVISTEKELKNTSNKLNQKIMVKNPSNVKKEKTTDPHENLQEKGKVIIRRVKTKQDLFGKTKLLDLEKRKIVSPGTRKTGLKKVSNLKKELPEEHFETESTLKKDMTWNIKKVENVKLDADSISLTNQVKTFKEESAKSVGVNTTETITIIITPNSEDSHKDKNVSTNNENFKGFKTANPDLGKSTIKSIKVASTLTNENETANKNEKLNENLLVNPVIEKNSETINKEDSNSTNSEASHKNKTAPVKKSENLQAVEKVLAENSITGRSENIEVQEPPVPLLDVLMIKCESDDEFFE